MRPSWVLRASPKPNKGHMGGQRDALSSEEFIT